MLSIRIVTTASQSKAVQIVYYRNRKRIVFKHIGSGKTDEEITSLKLIAQDIIDTYSPTLSLYDEVRFNQLLHLDKSEFLGIYYTYYYEVVASLIKKMGIEKLKKQLLLDLVIVRLLEPASKLRSIELLDTYFGIEHRRQSYYESAPQWLELKSKVESLVLDFAKQHYAFRFDLLFYDVTTLYFETFKEDELRKKYLLEIIDLFELLKKAFENSNPKDGLQAIIQNIQHLLDVEQVKPIDCMGKPFDRTCHYAISAIEKNDCKDDSIVDEIKKGYMIGDKILRPSQVVVAKNMIKKEGD